MPIKFISHLSYITQKENFQLSEGMCGILFFFYSFHNPKECAENSGCLNNASMNIEVHVSFWISVFSLDTYPGVELLDHMLFLLVKKCSKFSKPGFSNSEP